MLEEVCNFTLQLNIISIYNSDLTEKLCCHYITGGEELSTLLR